MQYELKHRVIEPRRNTFASLIDRYGDKPASRYHEGTIDVQPTEHFHYRPLWAPERELYDVDYTALQLTDPYSFTDPRQYYYAPYVSARAQLHDSFLTTLDYIQEHDLLSRMSAGWKKLIAEVQIPLRHYESGAQLISINGARFAYGTTIEQCLTYAAFDRIGNAQMISRLGIELGAGTTELLDEARQTWVGAPHQQGLRRTIEELLIEPDWAVGVVGLDLVDRLLYPLLYRHVDVAASLAGVGCYGLVARHMRAWYTDHRRWLEALYQTWLSDPQHAEANRTVLAGTVNRWLPQAVAAVRDVAKVMDANADTGAVGLTEDAVNALSASLSELGLLTVTEEA